MELNNMHKNLPNPPIDTKSYAEIIGEIGSSTKELIRSDMTLMIAEFKQISSKLEKSMSQIAIFGAILTLSSMAFLAFIIIALGNALEGQYWLSSLIVGLACALIGGLGVYFAIKKLKKEDLDFPKTKEALKKEGKMIVDEFNKVKNTMSGVAHESI